MNPDESKPLLLRSLSGQVAAVPPVWLMRQAGRYLPEYRAVRTRAGSFLDLCYNPALATEVTLQPVNRFGFDAAILFSDILVVPDGLGQRVRFVEGEGPRLEAITPATLGDLTLATLPDRLAPVYEAVTRIRTALASSCALVGFAGAPWTVATYMVEGGSSRDFLATRRWAYGNPEDFRHLIDLLVAATVMHLDAQIRAGADVVQLFDSWAGILPEAAFHRLVIQPTRAIVSALRQRHPGVPIIGFPRGAGALYPDYLAETGVTGLGLDSAAPTRWLRHALPDIAPVQGQLDPALLTVGGPAMAAAVAALFAAWGDRPWIFNLGHGIVPTTPPDHVAELVRLVRAAGRDRANA